MVNEEDELLFTDTEEEEEPSSQRVWKVMIVDDEQEVHAVTSMALQDIEFSHRHLTFLHAYSGQEAQQIIQEHPDTALILLDVVMEHDDAGLRVVRFIREKIKNPLVRIVLRTGQPGQAPESEVILNYDINDYKEKTDLTAKKLFTSVISSLRAYQDMLRIERNRRGLEKMLSASDRFHSSQSREDFVSGLLTQVLAVLGFDEDAFYSRTNAFHQDTSSFFSITPSKTANALDEMRVYTGSGGFQGRETTPIREVVDGETFTLIKQAFIENRNLYREDCCVISMRSHKDASLIFINGCGVIDETQRALIDIFCRKVAIAFDNIALNEEVIDTQKEIIYTLGTVVEFRSNETARHVERVAKYSEILALKAGLGREKSQLVKLASPLHDVGKIAIPDAVLNKPGRLTDAEFEIIKTHTTIGLKLLSGSKRPILQAAAIIAHQHQEKWDGSGYPQGLAGEDIHIYARITSVADVFDALSSGRCYKKAWPIEKTVSFMRENRGLHFDPHLVDLFLEELDKYLEIRTTLADKPLEDAISVY